MNQIQQVHLKSFYQSLAKRNAPLPAISDVGFSVYSQHDEDGILLFILSIIGEGNKEFIEIGCCGYGDRLENNTSNLAINHGWTGVMIDVDKIGLEVVDSLLNSHRNVHYWPIKLVNASVSSNNINELLQAADFDRDVDLLSIDIDSIDFHVIKALTINPRIIIVETPPIWGPGVSKTVPDDPRCNAQNNANYYGASLQAFSNLLSDKGYSLVAVNKLTTNAFFIRNDNLSDNLPPLKVSECFRHPRAKNNIKTRSKDSAHLPWLDV